MSELTKQFFHQILQEKVKNHSRLSRIEEFCFNIAFLFCYTRVKPVLKHNIVNSYVRKIGKHLIMHFFIHELFKNGMKC